MTRKSIDGYTLSGLIATVALVGVLSALAVPTWLGFTARIALSQDADSVQRFLQGAQSQAKKQEEATMSALRECQTDSQCASAWKGHVEQVYCGVSIQSLKEADSPLWEIHKKNQLRVFEDGSCSLPMTFTATLTDWVPSASQDLTPKSADESW